MNQKLDHSQLRSNLHLFAKVKSIIDDTDDSDIARGSNALTAQFTFIAIVLGVVLAALLFRLTSHNWIAEWGTNDILTAIFGFVTLLAVFDLWVKFAWGFILIQWPFEPGHTLISFFIGLLETLLALSIENVSLWAFSAAAFCLAAVLAYQYNIRMMHKNLLPKQAEKLNRKPSEIPLPVSLSKIQKYAWKQSSLLKSTKYELISALVYAFLMSTMGMMTYFFPSITFFAYFTAILGLTCVIFDLTFQALAMLNQRIIISSEFQKTTNVAMKHISKRPKQTQQYPSKSSTNSKP